ncbi:hypothetical protein D1839_16290 [Roseburia sp. 1XD42-34]|nr:hypothetical protein [Roseburia sp. 1XD42-34]RKI75452.1 hypothetical protein D7V87_16375 [Clostridium sp. 1xD42-85]
MISFLSLTFGRINVKEGIDLKFIIWLKHFKEINRPVGDLAYDILRDRKFPNSNSYADMSSYLERKLDRNQFKMFEKLYELYKSDIN